jgi:hypothetical protein
MLGESRTPRPRGLNNVETSGILTRKDKPEVGERDRLYMDTLEHHVASVACNLTSVIRDNEAWLSQQILSQTSFVNVIVLISYLAIVDSAG